MKTAITAIERVYSIKCRKPRLLKCLEFCVENILNDLCKGVLYKRINELYKWRSLLPKNGDTIKITWLPNNRGRCIWSAWSLIISLIIGLSFLFNRLASFAIDIKHCFALLYVSCFIVFNYYEILPYFEGGVGVSCYPRIFETIGFNFRQTGNGKMYDSFEVTKSV